MHWRISHPYRGESAADRPSQPADRSIVVPELPQRECGLVLDSRVETVDRQGFPEHHTSAVGLADLGEHGREGGGDHRVWCASPLRTLEHGLSSHAQALPIGVARLVRAIAQPVVCVAQVHPGHMVRIVELERLVVGVDGLLEPAGVEVGRAEVAEGGRARSECDADPQRVDGAVVLANRAGRQVRIA